MRCQHVLIIVLELEGFGGNFGEIPNTRLILCFSTVPTWYLHLVWTSVCLYAYFWQTYACSQKMCLPNHNCKPNHQYLLPQFSRTVVPKLAVLTLLSSLPQSVLWFHTLCRLTSPLRCFIYFKANVLGPLISQCLWKTTSLRTYSSNFFSLKSSFLFLTYALSSPVPFPSEYSSVHSVISP